MRKRDLARPGGIAGPAVCLTCRPPPRRARCRRHRRAAGTLLLRPRRAARSPGGAARAVAGQPQQAAQVSFRLLRRTAIQIAPATSVRMR